MLGHDLSGVRVHLDDRAPRALGARAFTSGRQITISPRHYAPQTADGRRLLGHELAHVAQQEGPSASRFPVLQRDGEPDVRDRAPLIPLPGGLTLFPGPTSSVALRGARLMLPGSLRLTNALGVGPGPAAVLDLSPRLLVGHVLDNIDLATWTRPGTPEGVDPNDDNQARISLVRPTITFDPTTGRMRAWGTLSVGSDYPLAFKGPTLISFEITSSELGLFTGRLGYGPLNAEFRLRLHYDTDRLEQALRPVFAPEGGIAGFWTRLQTIVHDTAPGVRLDDAGEALRSLISEAMAGRIDGAAFATGVIGLVAKSIPAGADLGRLRAALAALGTEITHPGFTVTGGLNLGRLPLSRFRATAPTTVPLARPLLGAPSAFPMTSSAYGVILAPPGAITSTTVPALGYTRSSFGATSGSAFTGALLPSISPSAITAGEPLASQFPVYLFAEYSYVRRISNDLDLGVRLTFQLSTPELVGAQPQSSDPSERFRRMLGNYRESSQPGQPPPPNIGLSLYGRFNAF
jgi:hypothetical protein